MSSRRTALILTTLDERIRLSLTRWLRVSERIERVHRISVSAAEWKALSAGIVGGALQRRLIVFFELHHPKVIAILGYERTGSEEEQREVQQAVRALQALNMEAEIRGFFMYASWATGRVDLGTDFTKVPRPEHLAKPPRERVLIGA